MHNKTKTGLDFCCSMSIEQMSLLSPHNVDGLCCSKSIEQSPQCGLAKIIMVAFVVPSL